MGASTTISISSTTFDKTELTTILPLGVFGKQPFYTYVSIVENDQDIVTYDDKEFFNERIFKGASAWESIVIVQAKGNLKRCQRWNIIAYRRERLPGRQRGSACCRCSRSDISGVNLSSVRSLQTIAKSFITNLFCATFYHGSPHCLPCRPAYANVRTSWTIVIQQ